ncbi:hypothetical protein PG988_012822 [Apiospora saccharicola]
MASDLTSQTRYIGVYPTEEEVNIPPSSWEKSFTYTGTYGGGAHYCKTCGVFVFSEVAGPLSRYVEGFDTGLLDIQRSDEGTGGYMIGS